MKAEIEQPSKSQSRLTIREAGQHGDEFIWSRWCLTEELDAIHAALTEWKAKREEKPKEPTWRAWKSAAEVPVGIRFVRFKTDIHKTPMAVACVHGCTVWIRYKAVETDLSLHGLWIWCEWSPDGVTWSKCGILEP
jgi:hypothetical protein